MKITVLYFGAFQDIFGCGEQTMDIAEETSGDDLLQRLFRERGADFNKWREKILLAVNREHARGDVVLRDRDELAVMPPLAGG